MKRTNFLAVPFALAASFLVLAPRPAAAQEDGIQFPQPSPLSTVECQVGLTTVEIEYSRPGMKGREIYGGLVPYGTMWRTGANKATKLTFSTDVTFGGEKLPAGSYALFTIPGKDEWTIVLSSNTEQWGTYNHDPEQDVLRVTAKPKMLAEPVETLTIGLAHLRDNSAKLVIDWAKTRVAVPIQTDLVAMLVPKIEAAMVAAGDDKPYLQAAMFYYEHDLDLAKALDWVEAAAMKQPEAPWVVYRKALIQKKAGHTAEAMATAKMAHELAMKAGGAVGAEYQRLSEELIASLQS